MAKRKRSKKLDPSTGEGLLRLAALAKKLGLPLSAVLLKKKSKATRAEQEKAVQAFIEEMYQTGQLTISDDDDG